MKIEGGQRDSKGLLLTLLVIGIVVALSVPWFVEFVSTTVGKLTSAIG